MKKIILLGVIFILSWNVKAQIILENTYTASGTGTTALQIKTVNLSISGYKYALTDPTVKQFRLYNMNHSLWKTINYIVPTGYQLNNAYALASFSESLFNSDNLVEVLYSVSQSNSDSVFVINENGNKLFSTSASLAGGAIINDGTNFKMVITDPGSQSLRVYSLPGTLPCNSCGGFSGISESNSNDFKQMISNPFPNPTNDKTTINYVLPEGVNEGKLVFFDVTGNVVKEFNVDGSFKDLQVSNSDLATGTYYYQLQTSKGTSGGKKLIVIK